MTAVECAYSGCKWGIGEGENNKGWVKKRTTLGAKAIHHPRMENTTLATRTNQRRPGE